MLFCRLVLLFVKATSLHLLIAIGLDGVQMSILRAVFTFSQCSFCFTYSLALYVKSIEKAKLFLVNIMIVIF